MLDSLVDLPINRLVQFFKTKMLRNKKSNGAIFKEPYPFPLYIMYDEINVRVRMEYNISYQ